MRDRLDDPGYDYAIERLGLTDESYRQMIQDAERDLFNWKVADLYWATADMTIMALDASRDLPVLNPGIAPAKEGIIAFGKPLPPMKPMNEMTADDGKPLDMLPSVDMLSWSAHGERLTVSVLSRTATFGPRLLSDGPMQQCFVITSDSPSIDLTPGDDLPEQESAILALLGACWHLMSMPNVATTRTIETKPERATALGTAPSATSPTVQLVDVRPLKHVTEKGDSTREYKHRWIVRGHWRNQPYDGGLDHKIIWIPSHIKGPAGAPFVRAEKVMVWRR